MRCLLTLILAMLCGHLWSQSIFISYFRPGNYLTDEAHRIELSRGSQGSGNLDGYLLVTRDYSVRLPAGTRIPANGTLSIAKSRAASQAADLYLSETKDFLIRLHLQDREGNYAVLINRNQQVVDAFYHGPSPNVPFLPDRDTCIAFDGTRIPYYLPPENRPVWSYLSTSTGDQLAFARTNGKWVLANAPNETPAPTRYRDLSLRYFDGIVTLKWTTEYEMVTGKHVLERSTDQIEFQELAELPSQGENENFQYYTFYDKDVAEDRVYYYRIRHSYLQGQEVYSPVRSVQTQAGADELSLELIQVPKGNQTELNLRFRSEYSQEIRIKLFDDRMVEQAILFDGFVYAGNAQLVKVSRPIAPGKYLVLVYTETKRIGKELTVAR